MTPAPGSTDSTGTTATTAASAHAALMLRRMRNYWIATAMLYVATMGLLAAQVGAGYTPRGPALVLSIIAACGPGPMPPSSRTRTPASGPDGVIPS